MSPHALRAGGIALGLVVGFAAARLADVLPARYGITLLASGGRRTRRNAVVVLLVAACGAGLGEVIARASSLPPWHAFLLLVVNLLAASAVIAGAAIDLEHMILPNELTIGGALVCLLSSPLRNVGAASSLVGAITGLLVAYMPFLLYKWLRGRSGMGLGDAKLAVLAGAWFGPLGAVLVLFGGVALMPLTALLMRIFGVVYPIPASVVAEIGALRARAAAGDAEARAELDDDPMASDVAEGTLATRLPLGPFLALACLVMLFARRPIEQHVLAWLGP